jgi:hypothetical protein
MLWLMVLAVWIVAVALVVARLVALRRSTSEVHLAVAVGVTLSVLPSRTAVVTLEPGADAYSAPVASLVEHAVNEAFAIETVNAVEVRSSDGQLLDRRCRAGDLLARRAHAVRPHSSSSGL